MAVTTRNIVHGVTASVRLIPNSPANATERAGNVYSPPYAIAPTTNAPRSGVETRVARRAIGRAIPPSYGSGDRRTLARVHRRSMYRFARPSRPSYRGG